MLFPFSFIISILDLVLNYIYRQIVIISRATNSLQVVAGLFMFCYAKGIIMQEKHRLGAAISKIVWGLKPAFRSAQHSPATGFTQKKYICNSKNGCKLCRNRSSS